MIRTLAGLPRLTNPQLHKLWRDLYNKEPPKIARPHLIRLLAWRMQEIKHGGLDAETRSRLKKDLAIFQRRGRVPGNILKPKVGVRFERLWRGERYCVVVQENGFEWEGRLYRSLSAVAKEITGKSAISGPRFFGLEGAGYEKKR
nr:DUF2924 domain-containing protein [Sansalvadorimonas sp. 2012CJ34-2]